MKISRPFNTLGLVAFLFAGTMFLASCKKDSDKPIDTGAGTFEFHLHNYVGDNEVEDYGTIYTGDDGRKISLDLAQLYLSHIQLVRPDGSIYEVSDFKILKKQESDVYALGKVPAGVYKTVRFHLGFDATDNQKAAAADAALLDHPEMWFGASPQPDGYVFLHVKGMVDPTKDATGTAAQMVPFDYKIGTASNYLQVVLPEKPFTVVKDQLNLVHLLADYSQVFKGIELFQPGNLSVQTAADNAIMPGTWITLNLENLFRYEE